MLLLTVSGMRMWIGCWCGPAHLRAGNRSNPAFWPVVQDVARRGQWEAQRHRRSFRSQVFLRSGRSL